MSIRNALRVSIFDTDAHAVENDLDRHIHYARVTILGVYAPINTGTNPRGGVCGPGADRGESLTKTAETKMALVTPDATPDGQGRADGFGARDAVSALTGAVGQGRVVLRESLRFGRELTKIA